MKDVYVYTVKKIMENTEEIWSVVVKVGMDSLLNKNDTTVIYLKSILVFMLWNPQHWD